MNGTMYTGQGDPSRFRITSISPPPLLPMANQPCRNSSTLYPRLYSITSSAEQSRKYHGSMQRNPSPPLLYRRKERYSAGNSKSQVAVSASMTASEAGGRLVHPAVESLKI